MFCITCSGKTTRYTWTETTIEATVVVLCSCQCSVSDVGFEKTRSCERNPITSSGQIIQWESKPTNATLLLFFTDSLTLSLSLFLHWNRSAHSNATAKGERGIYSLCTANGTLQWDSIQKHWEGGCVAQWWCLGYCITTMLQCNKVWSCSVQNSGTVSACSNGKGRKFSNAFNWKNLSSSPKWHVHDGDGHFLITKISNKPKSKRKKIKDLYQHFSKIQIGQMFLAVEELEKRKLFNGNETRSRYKYSN